MQESSTEKLPWTDEEIMDMAIDYMIGYQPNVIEYMIGYQLNDSEPKENPETETAK